LIVWAVNIMIGVALAGWITIMGMGGAISTVSDSSAMDYNVDRLLRSDAPPAATVIAPPINANLALVRVRQVNPPTED
jgi:hypothetical protein